MKIVGCDFHPRWQQVAVFDSETGEIAEHKLVNGDGEAERFYRALEVPALVGVEACGNSQWFLDLLERRGLVHVPTLRQEMAAEIPYFRPLAGGNLGEYGIHLESGR